MKSELQLMDERELELVSGRRYTGVTFVYVVQEGDKLPVLAQRFGTTVRVLRELNNLKNARDIKPGDRILIPQR